jgi:type IV pilus assembly protein PilY1
MVEQVFTSSGATRTIPDSTCNTINFANDRGFYLELPDKDSATNASERAHVNPQLQFGTLLVPTTVPGSGVCTPGGYGWLNYVDYKSGCEISGASSASIKTNSPIVGINVVVLPPKPGVPTSDRIKVSTVTADNPTPQVMPISPAPDAGLFKAKRAIWREMVK